MSRFTFPSVSKATLRYRIHYRDSDNPAYSYRQIGRSISSHISMFDTLGDGETQHTPDALVSSAEVRDVILSLSTSLHRLRIDLTDEDRCESKAVAEFWRDNPSANDDEMQFALGLKCHAEKPTFYTFKGGDGPRKSHADSKRHDRRWIRLHQIDEQTSDVDRVLTIINADDSGCATHGIINHLATVIRIAKMIEPKSWEYHVVKHLKASRGGVFESLDRADISQMLTCFEHISTFKRAIRELRWAIKVASNRQEVLARELAETSA